MKSETVLAKIVAAIQGSIHYDPDQQTVLHFREIGRVGCGVALIDRDAGETTFVEVTNQSHAGTPLPVGRLLTRGIAGPAGESGRG